MMRLMLLCLFAMAANAFVVNPSAPARAVAGVRAVDAEMFVGKPASTPKKTVKKAKGTAVPTAFQKGAKRPSASLNILERGPAGLMEPLKEGKKFFR